MDLDSNTNGKRWSQVNWRDSIYAERIVTTLSNALPFNGMPCLVILVENCGGLHVRGCQSPSSRGSGERNHMSPCHAEPGHRVHENDLLVQKGRRRASGPALTSIAVLPCIFPLTEQLSGLNTKPDMKFQKLKSFYG